MPHRIADRSLRGILAVASPPRGPGWGGRPYPRGLWYRRHVVSVGGTLGDYNLKIPATDGLFPSPPTFLDGDAPRPLCWGNFFARRPLPGSSTTPTPRSSGVSPPHIPRPAASMPHDSADASVVGGPCRPRVCLPDWKCCLSTALVWDIQPCRQRRPCGSRLRVASERRDVGPLVSERAPEAGW
jgi:hypothetical protein